MRDDSYLDSAVSARTHGPAWRAAAATAVGATISLAILAGVVIWSYRLGVRDAAEIPVIRAEAGLTKTRPAESGGQVAAHQDRAVFDAVTGARTAPSSPTALAPSPEALAEEDTAPAARAPAPEARPAEGAPGSDAVTQPPAQTAAPDPAAEEGVDPLAAAVEAALAEALGATPATTGSDEGAGDGAPRFAPVAAPRPAPQATTETAAPVSAAAVTASAVQIQLGAFESEAVAEAQWAAITARNGDLLSGFGRAVTPVRSGGATLYRLRLGPFGSEAEAAALCRALKVRRQECLVARAR